MTFSSHDHLFKMLLVGNLNVGKSSLLLRYVEDSFTNSSTPITIGVDFKVKTIIIKGQVCKLQIWDTAGGERFKTITFTYYRGTHGVLLCCDLQDPQSVADLPNWLEEIRQHAEPNVVITVVGCKSDLGPVDPEISQKLKEFCETNNLQQPMITSSLNGNNVKRAFEETAEAIFLST